MPTNIFGTGGFTSHIPTWIGQDDPDPVNWVIPNMVRVFSFDAAKLDRRFRSWCDSSSKVGLEENHDKAYAISKGAKRRQELFDLMGDQAKLKVELL